MTTLLFGSAVCEVDRDGNVTIPDFLSSFFHTDSEELLVTRHDADTCLVAYGRGRLRILQERLEARREAETARGDEARNHYRRMRRTFGAVEKAPCGPRTMRIPPAMRHLGKIGALALFVGTGDSFEIWNPDLALTNEDEQFRDLAAYQLKAHGEDNTALGVN